MYDGSRYSNHNREEVTASFAITGRDFVFEHDTAANDLFVETESEDGHKLRNLRRQSRTNTRL